MSKDSGYEKQTQQKFMLPTQRTFQLRAYFRYITRCFRALAMKFRSENDAETATRLLRILAEKSEELHDGNMYVDRQTHVIAKFSFRSLFRIAAACVHDDRKILTVTFTVRKGNFRIQGTPAIKNEGMALLKTWDARMMTAQGAAECVEELAHGCFRAREDPSIDSQVARVASELATYAQRQLTDYANRHVLNDLLKYLQEHMGFQMPQMPSDLHTQMDEQDEPGAPMTPHVLVNPRSLSSGADITAHEKAPVQLSHQQSALEYTARCTSQCQAATMLQREDSRQRCKATSSQDPRALFHQPTEELVNIRQQPCLICMRCKMSVETDEKDSSANDSDKAGIASAQCKDLEAHAMCQPTQSTINSDWTVLSTTDPKK